MKLVLFEHSKSAKRLICERGPIPFEEQYPTSRGGGTRGIVTAGLGFLGVVAGVAEAPILTSIRPEYVTTAPSVGAAFVVLGLTLWLQARVERRDGLVTALILVVGFGTAILILGDLQKTFLGNGLERFSAEVSPLTAFGLVLIASVQLQLLQPGPSRLSAAAPWIAALVAFGGFIVLLGYLYGTPPLYGGSIRPVGVVTAVAFLVLGLEVIFAAGPGHYPMRALVGPSISARLLRLFLPVTFLVVLGGELASDLLVRDSNPAITDAVQTLAVTLVVTWVIFRVAKITGRSLDQTEAALRTTCADLEKRVEERTADLTNAKMRLEADLTERKRLERELIDVTDREQHRIGRDLHDGMGQLLTGAAFLTRSLRRNLAQGQSIDEGELVQIEQATLTALEETRRVARGLVSLPVEGRGLAAALADLTSGIERLYAIDCVFLDHHPVRIGSLEVENQLYRIAQEAANNAVKNGHANQVIISLSENDKSTVLEIRDDGVGLGPGWDKTTGVGLRSMSYRASRIGGVLEICSTPDQGTSVTCTVAMTGAAACPAPLAFSTDDGAIP